MYFIRKLINKLSIIIYSYVQKLFLILWGVNYERNLSSYGIVRIYKKPRSKIKIGRNVIFFSKFKSNPVGINRPCSLSTFKPVSEIKIGNNCGFSGTVIGCFERVLIGNNVQCGANTLITDSDWHGILPQERHNKYAKVAPVIINDNVWLGVNVVVLKGVTIGKNTVIAANSVVVKDIPENVIAGGNPCKIIKKIQI